MSPDPVSPLSPLQDEPLGTVIDEPGDGPMYVPAPGEAQLTVRAVLVGCLIGAAIAAMNIRFGLKTGWSIGGSLIAAILGYALFSTLRASFPSMRRFTPLETNIAQTAGSAAGTMTSAAGLLSAIPALVLLEREGQVSVGLGWGGLTLWAASVAWLGVFYAVPLRRQMVLVERLRFPSGTATAATIVAMFGSGDDAVQKARWLIGFGVLAAVHTVWVSLVPAAAQPPVEAYGLWIGLWLFLGAWGLRLGGERDGSVFLLLSAPFVLLAWGASPGAVSAAGVAAAYGFTLYVSPLMLGAGILIGARVAASLLLGAVLAWGVLAPMVESLGWVEDPGATMSYTTGARGWVLWPGVAIMVADALTSLALSWRTIVATFTGGSIELEGVGADRDEEAIPASWWIGGLVASTVLTTVVAWWLFGIAPWMSVLAVAMSSVLAAIAVRSTGETDINPIGGMGKVTQLAYGGLAPGQLTTNLMTAGITSAGASQAGDMMHDLKTGWLLGSSARQQLVAQLVGATVGIFVCVPIFLLFVDEIGGSEYPAPAAFAWKSVAEVLARGLEALPTNALPAVLAGLLFGAAVPIARRLTGWTWLPSGLAIGIAFIVHAYFSVAMFLGAMLFLAWRRAAPASAERLGFAVASGLIAGDGLMGVVIPVVQLLRGAIGL